MKKRSLAFVLIFMLCLSMMPGCSSKTSGKASYTNTKTTETSVTTIAQTSKVEANTTTKKAETTKTTEITTLSEEAVILTDESASVYKKSDGSFNVVFGDNTCSMTFPDSWAGRFIIENNIVYCKKCWDSNERTGKLFTLAAFNTEEMDVVIPGSYLLGTSYYDYIVLYKPTDVDFDLNNSELSYEFNSMCSDIDSIISTASCQTSNGFMPIELGMYDTPRNYPDSLVGSWESSNMGVQFTPYITFSPDDGILSYNYALDGAVSEYVNGKYFMNTASADYQWNTDNWGNFGLIFLDGGIYSFTLYETAPTTISIEKLAGISQYDSLSSETWVYLSDFTGSDMDYID